MELTVELCDMADINIGVLSYSDAMKLNRLVGLALVRGFDFAIQHGNETGIRELLTHSLGITDSDLGQAKVAATRLCPHGGNIWDCQICPTLTVDEFNQLMSDKRRRSADRFVAFETELLEEAQRQHEERKA